MCVDTSTAACNAQVTSARWPCPRAHRLLPVGGPASTLAAPQLAALGPRGLSLT
jgi:hypothetical protein